MAQENVAGQDAEQRVDPGRVLPAFEAARAEFRQQPTPERLAGVQQRCSQLYSAMFSADVTSRRMPASTATPSRRARPPPPCSRCTPASKAFDANCAGGDKLAAQSSTDALFGFAVKCLSDSGLPSQQTDELRTKISYAEMNRDDKAHRFVVSWNAFLDGNRLAYLALAIAIGIDSLIFMTGLFGANAVRSPLADVPSHKGRNSQQLDAIIENALLPDTLDNARADHQRHAPDHQRVRLHGRGAPGAARSEYRAAACWACSTPARPSVRWSTTRRPAAISCARSCSSSCRSSPSARSRPTRPTSISPSWRSIVGVSLLPDINQNAETVLHYMHPIDEESGFMAEIKLKEVTPEHLRTVRNRSTPAPRSERVQRAGDERRHYFIHRDMYKTLARIRARTLMVDYGALRAFAGPRAGPDRRRRGADRRASADHAPAQPQGAGRDRRRPRAASDFVADLLGALRLKADAYERLAGPALGAAVAASKSFTRARQSNKQLDEQLTERDESARMALDRRLLAPEGQAQGPGQPRPAGLGRRLHRRSSSNWPVLMLLPGAPYERVVEEISRESGSRCRRGTPVHRGPGPVRICPRTGRRIQGQ